MHSQANQAGHDSWVVRGRVIRWIDPLTEPADDDEQPRAERSSTVSRHLASLLRALLPSSIEVRSLG